MGALIALQFRILWRGTPAFLRISWGLMIGGAAAFALSRGHYARDPIGGLAAGPIALALIGAIAAIGSAESMSWFTPVRPSARTWTRFAFLALTGFAVSAVILAVYSATQSRPVNPWPVVAAHLWACWVGGGLLLLFLGDLVHARNLFLQSFILVAGVAPGVAMSVFHLLKKCPWEILLAEAGIVAVLIVLNRIVNVDQEMRGHQVVPITLRQPGVKPEEAPAPTVPAAPSRKTLERVPAVGPVFRSGLTASPHIWILIGCWFLMSAMPIMMMHAVFGLIVLPFAFQILLNYWRPFQAVPLSRPKVFVLLTAPAIALWVLMLAVQGISVGVFSETSLIQSGHDGLEWHLPAAKRNSDSELSSELRRGPLPQSPDRLAALLSEAYRVSYGLEVPASEILALPVAADVTDTPAWLGRVQRHWEGSVTRRILEWRLLLGTALLAMGLLSMIPLLPGRCPRWLRATLLSSGFLMPMMLAVILTLETNILSNYLPRPFRSVYLAFYDRPGTLTAAFAVASVGLFFRNLRVFCTSELAETTPLRG